MPLHGLLSAACGTGAAPGAAKAGRGGGSASTAADRGLVEEPWLALPDAELTAQQKATKAELVKKVQVRCRSCIRALCIPRCCRAQCPARAHPGSCRWQEAEGGLLLLLSCAAHRGLTQLTARLETTQAETGNGKELKVGCCSCIDALHIEVLHSSLPSQPHQG